MKLTMEPLVSILGLFLCPHFIAALCDSEIRYGPGQLRFSKILSRSCYTRLYDKSLNDCAKECFLRRQRCKSFNYKRHALSCELCESDPLESELDDKPGSVHSSIATWNQNLYGACANKMCSNPRTQKCDPVKALEDSLNGFCDYSECEIAPSIPGTIKSIEETAVGTKLKYFCANEKLRAEGNAIIRCNENAEWTSSDFKCLCIDPPNVSGASLSSSTGQVGTSLSYMCNSPNMVAKGQPEIFCKLDGSWSFSDFTCECSQPPEIPGASTLSSTAQVGASVSYKCDNPVMVAKGSPVVVCQANGSWSLSNFTCAANTLPVVHEGSWETGDSVHYRMNGKCDFNLQSEIPANSLNINVTFSKPTQNYQHWIAAITSEAADGSWYYVNNIYNVYAPVMSYTFQVTYAGQTPPTGYCYISLPGVPQTSTTSAFLTSSTTKTPAPIASTASINASFNYSDALAKSILFYAAQRSGKLPTNNPISWRDDSALYDAGNNGEDLSGGWYTDGGHVKFNLPISSATTLLAIGFIQWKQAYTAAGQLDNMYDSIKWPLDYFIKCWRPDPNNPVYYAQVADLKTDSTWWGRPEDMTPSNMSRPAYKVTKNQPGSDVAGETSAALAAGSIVFRDKDLQYSNTLLNAAKTLYSFADTYHGKYSDAIQNNAQLYRSSGYNDELTLAAVMLYNATGDQSYLTDAENKYIQFKLNKVAWAQSWDEKRPVVQLLLYQATGKQMYADTIENYLRTWRNDVTKTPDGLAWRDQWGSLRYAANTAFVAMMAADLGLNPSINKQFAISQIDYMLGKNSRRFSYLVGFGNNFPRKAHHKASSCPVDKNQPCGWNDFNSPNDNPNVLVGALVSGPDASDKYADVRSDSSNNKVTCDYNAGFQGVLAGIIDYMMGQSG